MDTTRATLLAAIQDPANQRAWGDFYDTYRGFVTNLVRQSPAKLRPDEAEEVVQDVFVEILSGKVKYDRTKGKFRSLVTTVVFRRCTDRLRRRRMEFEKAVHRKTGEDRNTGTLDRIPAPHKSAYTQVAEQEWVHLVNSRASHLLKAEVSPLQFQLFEAAVLREIPAKQIAATLGVSPNQINLARSRVGKVYEQLLKKVAKDLDAPKLGKPARSLAECA